MDPGIRALLDARFKEQEPRLAVDLDRLVVVENLPTPEKSKCKRLVKYIYEHLIKPVGSIEKTDHVRLPCDAEDKGCGTCFIRFEKPEHARECVRRFDGNTEIFGEEYKLKLTQYGHIDFLLGRATEIEDRAEVASETRIAYDCSDIHKRLYVEPGERVPCELAILYKDKLCRFTLDGTGLTPIGAVIPTTTDDEEANTLVGVSYSPLGTYIIHHRQKTLKFELDNGTSFVLRPGLTRTVIIRSYTVSPCERFVLIFGYDIPEDDISDFDLGETIDADDQLLNEGKPQDLRPVTLSLWSITEQRILKRFEAPLRAWKTPENTIFRPENQVIFSGTGSYVILADPKALTVFKVVFLEQVYQLTQHDNFVCSRLTTMSVGPSRSGRDLLFIYQGASKKQELSSYSLIDLAIKSFDRQKHILVTRSFYASNGRAFWSDNSAALAFFYDKIDIKGVTAATLNIILLQHERVTDREGVSHTIISTHRTELIDLPQNLIVQDASWSHMGSILAFITIPVGSAKNEQEIAWSQIRLQRKATTTNSLQFSLKALDRFMASATNEHNKLLNDGNAAIYCLDLRKRYGEHLSQLSTPMNEAVKIRKVPGITASEVSFSSFRNYLVALNRNDRREPSLTMIDTETFEKTAAQLEGIDECAWDPSGCYLLARRFGARSSAGALYFVTVSGTVCVASTVGSIASNILCTIWRPFDLSLVERCAGKTVEEEYAYCQENYDALIAETADDGSRQEEIARHRARYLELINRESLTSEEERRSAQLIRACFELHGEPGDLSSYAADGSILPDELWKTTIVARQDHLQEVTAPATMSYEEFEKLYGPDLMEK